MTNQVSLLNFYLESFFCDWNIFQLRENVNDDGHVDNLKNCHTFRLLFVIALRLRIESIKRPGKATICITWFLFYYYYSTSGWISLSRWNLTLEQLTEATFFVLMCLLNNGPSQMQSQLKWGSRATDLQETRCYCGKLSFQHFLPVIKANPDIVYIRYKDKSYQS